MDNQPKVLDNNPIQSGDTVWAVVSGRKGKPVTVRALVETVDNEGVTVELYPELQLPVRFLVTVEHAAVELT